MLSGMIKKGYYPYFLGIKGRNKTIFDRNFNLKARSILSNLDY